MPASQRQSRTARSRAASEPVMPEHVMPAPQHVMVVGGSLVDWGALSEEAWASRCASLGAEAAAAAARWLTLRPFERGVGADGAPPVQHRVVDQSGCTVIVDPHPDGRDHLVVALRKLAESDRLTDGAIAPALLAPAEVEPDLVVLLGRDDRLPTSLVWELAYSELVYVDVTWQDLSADHLAEAMDAFRGRHRRFGGLD